MNSGDRHAAELEKIYEKAVSISAKLFNGKTQPPSISPGARNLILDHLRGRLSGFSHSRCNADNLFFFVIEALAVTNIAQELFYRGPDGPKDTEVEAHAVLIMSIVALWTKSVQDSARPSCDMRRTSRCNGNCVIEYLAQPENERHAIQYLKNALNGMLDAQHRRLSFANCLLALRGEICRHFA